MPSAAIVGAGPQGLAMLKNLLEEDFEATIFERRTLIGGLWQYTEDESQPSVLKSTLGNVSKYRNCFTDFPYPDDAPVHMTGRQTLEYLGSYADHFGLRKHIQLETDVKQVTRSADDERWELILQRGGVQEARCFDKIIFCTGRIENPYMPEIRGIESFTGKILHSQAFKRPEDFAGKKVLLVGAGNTAADIASDLVGIADRIYISHRGGQNIFSRWANGRPLDLFSNRRKAAILQMITYLAPQRASSLFKAFGEKLADGCYELDPAWGFKPAPFVLTHAPLVSETFVDHLRSGAVQSISSIRRLVGTNSVELNDGTPVEVDALIFCTGYRASFSLGPDLAVGKASSVTEPRTAGTCMPDPPRLYKNVFPPAHAASIAFLNNWQLGDGIAVISDVISMAIAQIWKGSFPLPSRDEMEQDIDFHQKWAKSMCDPGEEPPSYLTNKEPWLAWLNDAAGTGVNENLGYGWQGWRFYLSDPRFCSLLMGGIDSPHVVRLFDGRRKKWPGAREAILRANVDLKVQIEKHANMQTLNTESRTMDE